MLDAVGGSTADDSFGLLKKWTNAKLVTIVTPLLRNVDSMGFVPGAAQSAFALGSNLLRVSQSFGHIRPPPPQPPLKVSKRLHELHGTLHLCRNS